MANKYPKPYVSRQDATVTTPKASSKEEPGIIMSLVDQYGPAIPALLSNNPYTMALMGLYDYEMSNRPEAYDPDFAVTGPTEISQYETPRQRMQSGKEDLVSMYGGEDPGMLVMGGAGAHSIEKLWGEPGKAALPKIREMRQKYTDISQGKLPNKLTGSTPEETSYLQGREMRRLSVMDPDFPLTWGHSRYELGVPKRLTDIPQDYRAGIKRRIEPIEADEINQWQNPTDIATASAYVFPSKMDGVYSGATRDLPARTMPTEEIERLGDEGMRQVGMHLDFDPTSFKASVATPEERANVVRRNFMQGDYGDYGDDLALVMLYEENSRGAFARVALENGITTISAAKKWASTPKGKIALAKAFTQ